MAIDYLTKWVKARATRHNDAQTTDKFLYEEIFTRYGLPIELVNDRETHFLNDVIASLLDEFLVIHNVSAPYHPQANGQAESTNKTLCTIITKLVTTTRNDWEMLLQSALLGLQGSFQIIYWHHTFQSSVWDECCTTHGLPHTYPESSQKP